MGAGGNCLCNYLFDSRGFNRFIDKINPIGIEPQQALLESTNGLKDNWNEILYVYKQDLTVKQILEDVERLSEVKRCQRT